MLLDQDVCSLAFTSSIWKTFFGHFPELGIHWDVIEGCFMRSSSLYCDMQFRWFYIAWDYFPSLQRVHFHLLSLILFLCTRNLHGGFWQILFNQPYTSFTLTKPPLFSISAMSMHEFIHPHSLTTSRSFQTFAWNPGVLACLISNLP